MESWLAEMRGPLLELAMRRLGASRRHLAEDLVQDVLVKTLAARPRCNSREELGAYLRRSLLNGIATMWKRRELVREESLPDGCGAPRLASAQSSGLSLHELRPLRARLSFEAEVTLFLRGELGCSFESLTAVLDLPTSGAAARFHLRSLERWARLARAAIESGARTA